MKLTEAIKVLEQVNGRQYSYMKDWGLSTIREAIWTVNNRNNVTKTAREMAESIQNKISRRY